MTPTLLIWFNRPQLSQEQWSLIKDHLPGDVFIAIDGPREGRASESEKVNQCIQFAKTLVPEDRLLIRNQNLGCGLGVSGAISWFFSKVEEGIILEDDCWPDHRFYMFAVELLERYRNDTRVMGISGDGTCVKDPDFFQGYSYGYARLPLIWGWATWKRAWEDYEYSLESWPERKEKGQLFDITIHEDSYNALYDMFENVHRGIHKNNWDYQWLYKVVFSGGCFIIPNGNLVRNEGFGVESTHTQGTSPRASAPYTFHQTQLIHPEEVRPNLLLEESIYRHGLGVRKKSPYRRILKRFLPSPRGRITYEFLRNRLKRISNDK